MTKINEWNPHAVLQTAPPKHLADLLASIGGRNPYGQPYYRLVRAEERLTPSGGVWVDWDPKLPQRERNVLKNKPIRRVAEVRLIKRYGPAEGWLLERWVPAKAYGSRQRWYASASVGGTMVPTGSGTNFKYVPSQGVYPSKGDYEYTGYSFEAEQLSTETVITAMQIMRRGIEQLPQSPSARIALRSRIAKAAVEVQEKQYEQWSLDVIESMQPAFGGNAFAGAGPKYQHSSQAILDRLGIKSHHI